MNEAGKDDVSKKIKENNKENVGLAENVDEAQTSQNIQAQNNNIQSASKSQGNSSGYSSSSMGANNLSPDQRNSNPSINGQGGSQSTNQISSNQSETFNNTKPGSGKQKLNSFPTTNTRSPSCNNNNLQPSTSNSAPCSPSCLDCSNQSLTCETGLSRAAYNRSISSGEQETSLNNQLPSFYERRTSFPENDCTETVAGDQNIPIALMPENSASSSTLAPDIQQRSAFELMSDVSSSTLAPDIQQRSAIELITENSVPSNLLSPYIDQKPASSLPRPSFTRSKGPVMQETTSPSERATLPCFPCSLNYFNRTNSTATQTNETHEVRAAHNILTSRSVQGSADPMQHSHETQTAIPEHSGSDNAAISLGLSAEERMLQNDNPTTVPTNVNQTSAFRDSHLPDSNTNIDTSSTIHQGASNHPLVCIPLLGGNVVLRQHFLELLPDNDLDNLQQEEGAIDVDIRSRQDDQPIGETIDLAGTRRARQQHGFCQTCFFYPIETRNYPCGCVRNCIRCSGEMYKKCSQCQEDITAVGRL